MKVRHVKALGIKKIHQAIIRMTAKHNPEKGRIFFMKENVFTKWDFTLLNKQTGNEALISFLSSL